MREAKDSLPGDVKTLRDAFREYAEKVSPEKRGHSKELIRLRAFEGAAHVPLPVNKRLAKVTQADLIDWRDARLRVTARGSVLRDMTLMAHVFEVARRDWRWIDENQMKFVRRPAEPDHREVLRIGNSTDG